MPNIKLSPFAPSESTVTYTTGQTIATFLGKDGKIGWANATNFFNKEKKLSVQMIVKGQRYYINCSGPLGTLARSNKTNFEGTSFLNKLMSCHLTESEDEDGNIFQFIGLPEGVTASQLFSASELTPEPFVMNMKDLVNSSI